jgi:hypothetical protein
VRPLPPIEPLSPLSFPSMLPGVEVSGPKTININEKKRKKRNKDAIKTKQCTL